MHRGSFAHSTHRDGGAGAEGVARLAAVCGGRARRDALARRPRAAAHLTKSAQTRAMRRDICDTKRIWWVVAEEIFVELSNLTFRRLVR